jgi:hypothetical protein
MDGFGGLSKIADDEDNEEFANIDKGLAAR